MNYYQKILMVIFGISLALVPKPFVLSAAEEYQIVQALSSQQVNLRAKQITVRIDGDNSGSGIIIASSDQKYTILTNWHIVKDLGNYIVQTVDGRQHEILPDSIRQLPNVDLAIFQFTSEQNYQIAEVGNSNNLIEGQNIYFAGYPGELRTESDRVYRFFTSNLVGLLDTPNANGYSLIYDGSAFPGMSGGPVLNAQGLVIGIHGETNIHAVTGAVSNYAIPSNVYHTAIANINSSNQNSANADTKEAETENNSTVVPKTIVETNDIEQPTAAADSEPTTTSSSNNNQNSANTVTKEAETENNNTVVPETIVETNDIQQPTAAINPSESKSVPVFTSPQNQEQDSQITNSNNLTKPEKLAQNTTTIPEENVNNPTDNSKPKQSNQVSQESNRQVELISKETGIDYTELQNLLAQQKWVEADRETKKDISNIFQTITRKNGGNNIELTTLADRACNDFYTIDFLWRKFSGDRFGLSRQQDIWQNLNQNNNFSINVWRSFVTEIGWKQGDLNSVQGYLLYEQLNFNPQTAPQGHLPWWFDYSTDEKDAMRQVLTRCNLQANLRANNS